jgi:hypothetical protein
MDYTQLSQIEELRSLASQRELSKLQRKEAELRGQLAALKAYRSELHAPDPGLRPMRAIGADILWNRWLDQTQTTLNMSLARVLAQKEGLLRKVRRAVGRAETVNALRAQTEADHAREIKKKRLEALMAQSVTQHLFQR